MNDYQVQHETGMLIAGVQRYNKQQKAATKQEKLTSAEDRLFASAIGNVEEAMQAALDEQLNRVGGGMRPHWFDAMGTLGAMKCAAVALRFAFNGVDDESNIVTTIQNIGRQIELCLLEESIRVSALTPEMTAKEQKAALKAGEKIFKALVKKSTGRSLEYRSTKFAEHAKDSGFWSVLDAAGLVLIGAGLLDFVLSSSGIFQRVAVNEGRSDGFISLRFTEEAAETMGRVVEFEQWMHPVHKPMLTKPAEWTSFYTGAYADQRMAKTVPLFKSYNKTQIKLAEEAVKENAPFVQALNTIQSVPLQANLLVAHYMKFAADNLDIIHAKGFKLKGYPEKLQVVGADDEPAVKSQKLAHNKKQRATARDLKVTLKTTEEYLTYGKFYQPAVCDWRGRVYAKNSVNHQREDSVKALFLFHEGQVLTTEGGALLGVHLANCFAAPYGNVKMDKAPLLVRHQWAIDNTERIEQMMLNPEADLLWLEADAPFMFLAAADAWVNYRQNPYGYKCHLPIAVDGSCSGLQHLSAVLRDEVGAASVNLIDGETPADIYQVVADAVKPLVEKDAADGNIFAQRWLEATGITRKVTKRSCMTFVYGSPQFGMATHLQTDFANELASVCAVTKWDDESPAEYRKRAWQAVNDTAHYLAKYIWDAVNTSVKAAAEAMKWMQLTATLLAKNGIPLAWTSPSGFPVINGYYKLEKTVVSLTMWDHDLKVSNRMQTTVMTGITNDLAINDCKNGIAPNAVHSWDASHLHFVANAAAAEGITSQLLIHDSFGCLPNDMPRYSQIVREEFVRLYAEHDPLESMYEYARDSLMGNDAALNKLLPPPAKGSLDLQEILEAKYAFC